MGAKVRLARNGGEVGKVLRIREIVFFRGQNVPLELEMGGLDDEARHVVAFWGKKQLGARESGFSVEEPSSRDGSTRGIRREGNREGTVGYLPKYCIGGRRARRFCTHGSVQQGSTGSSASGKGEMYLWMTE
jgi:hypothetical protein